MFEAGGVGVVVGMTMGWGIMGLLVLLEEVLFIRVGAWPQQSFDHAQTMKPVYWPNLRKKMYKLLFWAM